MATPPEPPFPIWQGFHHAWTYNHRLNRFGDWLRTTARDGDTLHLEVGHSGASGTGPDLASFDSFRSVARAKGVYHREFRQTFDLYWIEEATRAFLHDIRLGPDAGIPDSCDRFVAVLSGFDLCSEKDADKLASFHLALSPPSRDPATNDIVFQLAGALNVDCDSPECDLHDSTGAMIGAILAGGALLGTAGAAFGALFSKLNIATDYRLDVRFALLAGNAQDFNVTHHRAANLLSWDKQDPITLGKTGTLRGVQMQGDTDLRWRASVPAITQVSLDIARKRGTLKPDTAMHLLEWDMAVRPTTTTGTHCIADLELFFRNWRAEPSDYLDAYLDAFEGVEGLDALQQDIYSHRDAGWATAIAGLALLQFAQGTALAQESWTGSLLWQGEGRSAKSDGAVRLHEAGPYTLTIATEPPPPPDGTPFRIAVELATCPPGEDQWK